MNHHHDHSDLPVDAYANIQGDDRFEQMLDAMLDRELSDDDRVSFMAGASRDTAKRHRVLSTTRAVSLLRDPVPAPDLSGAILSRVECRNPLLSEHLSRLVRPSRVAAVAATVAVALGLVGLRGALVRAQSEKPVASLATATASDLRDAPASVSTGVDALGTRLLDAVLPPADEHIAVAMDRSRTVVMIKPDPMPVLDEGQAVAAAIAIGLGPVAAPVGTPLVVSSATPMSGQSLPAVSGNLVIADTDPVATPVLVSQTVVRNGNAANHWANAQPAASARPQGAAQIGWFSEYAVTRPGSGQARADASRMLFRTQSTVAGTSLPHTETRTWLSVTGSSPAVSTGYTDTSVRWTSRADGSLVRYDTGFGGGSESARAWSKLLAPLHAGSGEVVRTLHGGTPR